MIKNVPCFILFLISMLSTAAESLLLPYLRTCLDSIGTNFRHGANFATAGSSVRPGGYSPFHLPFKFLNLYNSSPSYASVFPSIGSSWRCIICCQNVFMYDHVFGEFL